MDRFLPTDSYKDGYSTEDGSSRDFKCLLFVLTSCCVFKLLCCHCVHVYRKLTLCSGLSLRATHVPVGEDQVQHLELAQVLARIFNNRYGDLFPEPRALMSKITRTNTTAHTYIITSDIGFLTF